VAPSLLPSPPLPSPLIPLLAPLGHCFRYLGIIVLSWVLSQALTHSKHPPPHHLS
jgi:hypothetical protein